MPGGLEDGTQLGEEDLGVVQGQAQPPPAQEGVVLPDGQVGQELVAADVQGSDGDRVRREGLEHLAVDPDLLFLAGESVPGEEGELGPVQADPLRPAAQGRLQIR